MTPRNTILIGDALDHLRHLAPASIEAVVTSPPFFRQRNYGADGQIGLEDTVEQWVERLQAVMAEVHRILVPTGSAWIDLGDSYSRSPRMGAAAKSLLLAPERFALAMVADGWILRNKVIWAKRNPMPDSVKDRLSNTYDVVFHLVKQPKYFYDLDSIRVPHTSKQGRAKSVVEAKSPDWAGPHAGNNSGLKRFRPPGVPLVGKNPGDVWSLPTAHFQGAHFATFPERLVEPPILATCPLRVCVSCSAPWNPEPGKTFVLGHRGPAGGVDQDRHVRRYPSSWQVLRQPGPLKPGCECQLGTRPGIVLDPFFGTGTVGAVAERLGRDWLGIEISDAYADLAWQRLGRGSPGPELQAA
jgi:site-specific DNA-methyltransferase (adenine-specific)